MGPAGSQCRRSSPAPVESGHLWAGLGALVTIAKQCNEAGRRFVVVGNSRVVQTVKLVRLEAFLHLQPDLPTALGALSAA